MKSPVAIESQTYLKQVHNYWCFICQSSFIEMSYMYNSFRTGCSTSTRKVILLSGRNYKNFRNNYSFFLSCAVHTNAVGLQRSAWQPRIADRVGGRIFFKFMYFWVKRISLMKDIKYWTWIMISPQRWELISYRFNWTYFQVLSYLKPSSVCELCCFQPL